MIIVYSFLSLIVLFIAYSIVIQYERGGYWELILKPFALPVLIYDVIVNIFVISILFLDFPLKYSKYLGRREYSYSDRLERLALEDSLRGDISYCIAKVLNMIAPSKTHIKSIK